MLETSREKVWVTLSGLGNMVDVAWAGRVGVSNCEGSKQMTVAGAKDPSLLCSLQ